MRALALTALAVTVLGCNAPTAATGESAEAQTAPDMALPAQCVTEPLRAVLDPDPAPIDNPWVDLGLKPGYVVYTFATGGVWVLGYDSTLTTREWLRFVTSDAPDHQPALRHYQQLPQTIQFAAQISTEIGQVGGTEVDTGGGNEPPPIRFCLDQDQYVTLHGEVCQPEPQICADQGQHCGTATDACLNDYNCGTCAANRYCDTDTWTCQLKNPPPPIGTAPCKGKCI